MDEDDTTDSQEYTEDSSVPVPDSEPNRKVSSESTSISMKEKKISSTKPTVPEGFDPLLNLIIKEVLFARPSKLGDFIADRLEAEITRRNLQNMQVAGLLQGHQPPADEPGKQKSADKDMQKERTSVHMERGDQKSEDKKKDRHRNKHEEDRHRTKHEDNKKKKERISKVSTKESAGDVPKFEDTSSEADVLPKLGSDTQFLNTMQPLYSSPAGESYNTNQEPYRGQDEYPYFTDEETTQEEDFPRFRDSRTHNEPVVSGRDSTMRPSVGESTERKSQTVRQYQARQSGVKDSESKRKSELAQKKPPEIKPRGRTSSENVLPVFKDESEEPAVLPPLGSDTHLPGLIPPPGDTSMNQKDPSNIYQSDHSWKKYCEEESPVFQDDESSLDENGFPNFTDNAPHC